MDSLSADARPTSRLSWVRKTVIALTVGSAPFEASIPLRVRSRVTGSPRPHGRSSKLGPLQRLTANASEPRTRLRPPPRGRPATRAPGPKTRARGAKDQQPFDRARPHAENDARPTRQTPVRLIPQSSLASSRADRNPPVTPRARSRGHWAAPPLGGDSFPPDLSTLQKSRASAFGASECEASDSFPTRKRAARLSCLS